MKKAMLIAALLIAVIATPFVIENLSVDAPTEPSVDTTYLPPSVEAVSLVFTETPSATETATEEIPTYSQNENIPLPFELQVIMQQACEKYGVPYALALAVAESESSFDLEADSGTLCRYTRLTILDSVKTELSQLSMKATLLPVFSYLVSFLRNTQIPIKRSWRITVEKQELKDYGKRAI